MSTFRQAGIVDELYALKYFSDQNAMPKEWTDALHQLVLDADGEGAYTFVFLHGTDLQDRADALAGQFQQAYGFNPLDQDEALANESNVGTVGTPQLNAELGTDTAAKLGVFAGDVGTTAKNEWNALTSGASSALDQAKSTLIWLVVGVVALLLVIVMVKK